MSLSAGTRTFWRTGWRTRLSRLGRMHIDWLRQQTGALADAATGVDPGRQVLTCPEWSVRDLVGHVGHVQRRAAKIVRSAEAVPFPREAVPPAEWAAWLREGADHLADEVSADENKDVWSFLGDRRRAFFWLRRMVHDTTIHAVDAALTAGVPYEIPAELAKDGIEEVLDLVVAMTERSMSPPLAELPGDGETLLLKATEGDRWLVTRTPDGPAWERAVTGEADATVTGTARELLLLLYRRLDAADVAVSGNGDLVTHWLANTAL